jgi:serine/threonine protein kinase
MTSQLDAVPAEPSGKLLAGRYRLGAPLGSGGMGVVHRGLDTRLERVVAVKVFRADADPVAKRRFDDEARLLAGLEHPGLVTVFDAGVQDDRAFLVMQLVNGHTLREEIHCGPLDPDRIAALGARLADTLAHVHSRGVVHRDLKPSNILLDGDGRPYLADFGVSLLADGTRLSTGGKLVGTAAYLAPEQVRGEAIAPESDIYALGLVLLECFTGEPEYDGSDVEAAVARLSRAPRIPATIPEELGRVLTAMTADRPEQRPDAAGCAELLAAAAGALAAPGAPTHLMPETPLVDRPGRATSPNLTRTMPADVMPASDSRRLLPRTRRGRVTAVALTAAALAGVGAVAFSDLASRATAPPPADGPPAATGQPAPSPVPTGPVQVKQPDPAASPPGRDAPGPGRGEDRHHRGHGKGGG